MKIILFIEAFVVLISFALFTSCKEENSITGPTSRLVKYELLGSFSGTFTVTYTKSNGSNETIQVSTLPWILEFTAAENVNTISIGAVGNSGSQGQTSTLKIFIGGVEKESVSGVANSLGGVSLSPRVYIFP